jgi:hypothetical protein
MPRHHRILRTAAWLLLLGLAGWAWLAQGRDHPDDDRRRDQPVPLRVEHIFKGSINYRGELVGMHHIPSAPREMRVDGQVCKVEFVQTSVGGPKDVVTARVKLVDPATGKVVREKFSTLFPSDWTRAEIEEAIRAAYADAQSHNGVDRDGRFHGHAHGIRIDGYMTRDGQAIATAFPVLPPSPNKSGPAPRSNP